MIDPLDVDWFPPSSRTPPREYTLEELIQIYGNQLASDLGQATLDRLEELLAYRQRNEAPEKPFVTVTQQVRKLK